MCCIQPALHITALSVPLPLAKTAEQLAHALPIASRLSHTPCLLSFVLQHYTRARFVAGFAQRLLERVLPLQLESNKR
jgi:hypothetical protein